MTKEESRKEAIRLLNCYSLKDSFELIEIYLKFLFMIIEDKDHHAYNKNSFRDRDSRMICHMIFTKVASLKEIAKGISYDNGKNYIDGIIDPTIVASFIRTIYETVTMFNLIFINTKTEDEKIILYNLWVVSGLNYRQRFQMIAETNDSQRKLENEKKDIEELISEIKNTELYSRFNKKNQDKINTKIKEKDYKIEIINNNVNFLSWQDLTKTIGFKKNLLDTIYNYFSMYSHPSNVSVFQFSDMFSKTEINYLEITNVNLKSAFILVSVFIADYIKLFPNILSKFEELTVLEQIGIDFQNVFARGDKYSINNCLGKLN